MIIIEKVSIKELRNLMKAGNSFESISMITGLPIEYVKAKLEVKNNSVFITEEDRKRKKILNKKVKYPILRDAIIGKYGTYTNFCYQYNVDEHKILSLINGKSKTIDFEFLNFLIDVTGLTYEELFYLEAYNF